MSDAGTPNENEIAEPANKQENTENHIAGQAAINTACTEPEATKTRRATSGYVVGSSNKD